MNNLARYLSSLRKSEKTLYNTFALIPIAALLNLNRAEFWCSAAAQLLENTISQLGYHLHETQISPAISRSKANMYLYCLHSASFNLASIKKKRKRKDTTTFPLEKEYLN